MTDRVEDATVFISKFKKTDFKIHQIEKQDWVSGTLLRYRHYVDIFEKIDQDFILHLDADMLIAADFIPNLIEAINNHSNLVHLTLHPGYWRQRRIYFPYLMLSKMYKSEFKNLFLKLKGRNLGDWESNSRSSAFVPYDLRKSYYCGAVWFGRRNTIRRFLLDMVNLIDKDIHNNKLAKWHDESYLNRWAAYNQHVVHPPSYCYVENYQHLSKLKKFIIAVDK
jgi:hypothetical protein